MTTSTEERIERLLDQLEKPGLSQLEIDHIKDKINFLRETQS